MTQHTLHIPVMGTCFTIDTPIKVAKFGISSAISLVDDGLIEKIRRHHSGEDYKPIKLRSERITAYLDLLNKIVNQQVEEIRAQKFEQGTDLDKYFEMLPTDSPLRKGYYNMLQKQGKERKDLETQLREQVMPGSIDANIMIKLHGIKEALEGLCNTNFNAGLVLSAGSVKGFREEMAKFDCFYPGGGKRVIIKVSDLRSARLQGKLLARKGIWVDEYRIESGLNCGGHAFPTNGELLGPVLQEFQEKRGELVEKLAKTYRKALREKGITAPDVLNSRVTVQAGISTGEETKFLMDYFKVDGTGEGTPYLLVPEATDVDGKSQKLLIDATRNDVRLSDSSPLGVQFWNLMTSLSEERRRELIAEGKPGTPCINGYLAIDELGDKNVCTASRQYQKAKIAGLDPKSPDYLEALEKITEKSCICFQLGDGALIMYDIEPEKEKHPAVCPGPNIADFNRTYSLDEMMGHFYGRKQVAESSKHMFIRELEIYIENLENGRSNNEKGHVNNLFEGIAYYKTIAGKITDNRFSEDLKACEERLKKAA